MGINYNTEPKSFEELCNSVRGQVERKNELSFLGMTVPREERVVMTPEATLALLDRVQHLTGVVASQTLLFSQIEQIFGWIFGQLGVDIQALADGDSDEEE
jgi:hypothetical protein